MSAIVPCLLCGRPLDAAAVPAFLTVIDGVTCGLCMTCAARPAAPRALAAVLGLPVGAMRAVLLGHARPAARAARERAAD